MLSHQVMTVREFCEFGVWLKAKGYDGDELIQDPDAFEDEWYEYQRENSGEQVPAPVAPTMHGLTDYPEVRSDR